jgi:hypothetical protein
MHESLFASAALPAQVRVCGLPLKHFSIGHSLHLIRSESPFVSGEAVLPGDVFTAVWICASTWKELRYRDYLHCLKLALLKRAVAKSDHAENVKALIEYFKNGALELPASEIIRPDRDKCGRDAGAPFLLRLQQFLMIYLGKSESEAWDYPLGFAKMRWQTYWEQEGGFDVKNSKEVQMDEMIRLSEEKLSDKKEGEHAGD